jgi:hypothetical protein
MVAWTCAYCGHWETIDPIVCTKCGRRRRLIRETFKTSKELFDQYRTEIHRGAAHQAAEALVRKFR